MSPSECAEKIESTKSLAEGARHTSRGEVAGRPCPRWDLAWLHPLGGRARYVHRQSGARQARHCLHWQADGGTYRCACSRLRCSAAVARRREERTGGGCDGGRYRRRCLWATPPGPKGSGVVVGACYAIAGLPKGMVGL